MLNPDLKTTNLGWSRYFLVRRTQKQYKSIMVSLMSPIILLLSIGWSVSCSSLFFALFCLNTSSSSCVHTLLSFSSYTLVHLLTITFILHPTLTYSFYIAHSYVTLRSSCALCNLTQTNFIVNKNNKKKEDTNYTRWLDVCYGIEKEEELETSAGFKIKSSRIK